MKIPPRLLPLVEDGIIDEVIGQVRSGKEADVFTVRVGEEIRCAKVYKEAIHRSFRQSVNYQEGRAVKNSRTARAQSRGSRFGQKEAETSWITAEVNALNALSAAGLRVPKPFGFFDGVLIMELIVDADGEPAPRLNDLELTPDKALDYHEFLIDQILQMLCMGLIHGDLSEFNVLVDANGPVIIDLPQVVNAAGNMNAAMMFARDVNNMAAYFGRFEPGILTLKYAKEMWSLFEKGKLNPHVELTGQFIEPKRAVDVRGMLSVIDDVRQERDDKLARQRGEPRPGYGANRGPGRDPVHGIDPGAGGGQGRDSRPNQQGSSRNYPQANSNRPQADSRNHSHPSHNPQRSSQGSQPGSQPQNTQSGARHGDGSYRAPRSGDGPQRPNQNQGYAARHNASTRHTPNQPPIQPQSERPPQAGSQTPNPVPGAQPSKPKPSASEPAGQDNSWGRRPQRGERRNSN